MVSYRAILAWVPCWMFFGIGDLICRIKMFGNWEWPWTIYQGVMLYSSNLQHWAGVHDETTNSLWPWHTLVDSDGDQA